MSEPVDAKDLAPAPVEWPLCGYAPGKYFGRCGDCGGEMWDVDKRAQRCLACAVQSAKAGLEEARTLKAERDAFRTQAINRGWNWNLCKAYGRDEYELHLASEVDGTLEVMMGRKTLEESLRDGSGTDDMPEVTDWSGAVRGKFHQPPQG